VWAVWAAESPTLRVEATNCGGEHVRLAGTKPWCSGAAGVTHALLTAWTDEEKPILAAVSLEEGNVGIDEQAWHAVGMAPTATAQVTLNGCIAARIGGPGDYVSRPGFWHGAAGIAACWYGAAMAIAATAREHARLRRDPHTAAHIGALAAELAGASAALREAAASLDDDAVRDFRVDALRIRAVVENAAERVLRHAGRAMGPAAFCNDAAFARLAADLPVFLRQSHAERDLAVLGQQLAEGRAHPWAL
jgi:alkylation response protein AidB-like acyl-CoA dehydrogenase